MRQTGILMPLSALPSRTGIGELGEFAYRWIEKQWSEDLAAFATESGWIRELSISALFFLCRG